MNGGNDFLEYILEQLESLGDIEVKKMFGAFLLKVEGEQLGIVIDDIFYLKVVDKEIQERYREEGSVQFEYKKKTRKEPVVIKNWWSVPERALEDRDYLLELTDEVLNQKSK